MAENHDRFLAGSFPFMLTLTPSPEARSRPSSNAGLFQSRIAMIGRGISRGPRFRYRQQPQFRQDVRRPRTGLRSQASGSNRSGFCHFITMGDRASLFWCVTSTAGRSPKMHPQPPRHLAEPRSDRLRNFGRSVNGSITDVPASMGVRATACCQRVDQAEFHASRTERAARCSLRISRCPSRPRGAIP